MRTKAEACLCVRGGRNTLCDEAHSSFFMVMQFPQAPTLPSPLLSMRAVCSPRPPVYVSLPALSRSSHFASPSFSLAQFCHVLTGFGSPFSRNCFRIIPFSVEFWFFLVEVPVLEWSFQFPANLALDYLRLVVCVHR